MGLHMRGSFCANLWTASGLEKYQVPRDTGAVISAKRNKINRWERTDRGKPIGIGQSSASVKHWYDRHIYIYIYRQGEREKEREWSGNDSEEERVKKWLCEFDKNYDRRTKKRRMERTWTNERRMKKRRIIGERKKKYEKLVKV